MDFWWNYYSPSSILLKYPLCEVKITFRGIFGPYFWIFGPYFGIFPTLTEKVHLGKCFVEQFLDFWWNYATSSSILLKYPIWEIKIAFCPIFSFLGHIFGFFPKWLKKFTLANVLLNTFWTFGGIVLSPLLSS